MGKQTRAASNIRAALTIEEERPRLIGHTQDVGVVLLLHGGGSGKREELC